MVQTHHSRLTIHDSRYAKYISLADDTPRKICVQRTNGGKQ